MSCCSCDVSPQNGKNQRMVLPIHQTVVGKKSIAMMRQTMISVEVLIEKPQICVCWAALAVPRPLASPLAESMCSSHTQVVS